MAYLFAATVAGSPVEGVVKSNFTDETPNRIQKTISWGMKAYLASR